LIDTRSIAPLRKKGKSFSIAAITILPDEVGGNAARKNRRQKKLLRCIQIRVSREA
jgi:hypothetical protein